MKYSLRSKLTISYLCLALLLVALISLLTNVFLEKQFREYVIKQQENRNQDIVNMIGQQYRDNGRSWDLRAVENIGIDALEQGLIVKVINKEGQTVWDAVEHNYGLCTQMIDHMAQNMTSRYPDFQGEYEVRKYVLSSDAGQAGSVEIGYYGPYFFNDNDLAFINTLNKLLGGVGLFSLLLAFAAGAYTSRRLTLPLSKAVQTARRIGEGHYNQLITDYSDTIEINELTSTINDLAVNMGKQEQLRRRLTADVAHELRTPLATLQSHLEAMIDGIWEPDASRLSSCHEEIVRISRMVGDLEELARYESEKLTLMKEEFDLKDLVQSAVHNFEAEYANKGVSLKYKGENSLVLADPDKIMQVAVNLLSNALKYTPEGGMVEVAVEETGILKVKDNGTGIGTDDLPNIFERFYRADESRTRDTGGAGIGLAIAKAIVDAHGGRIEVSSKLGEGSQFTVYL